MMSMTEPIDHFERRGCYELALAILHDCLRQIIQDPAAELPETQAEWRWLDGLEPQAVVTSEQVLTTLGMSPDGSLQGRFRRIAHVDPSLALGMISGPRISAALSSMTRCGPVGQQHDLQPAATRQAGPRPRAASITARSRSAHHQPDL
jgi:hypothetical protein